MDGSGVGVTGGGTGERSVTQSVEMTFVSIVTAAFSAMARPHAMLAPVVRVTL